MWMKCKLGAEPRERCGKELRREEGKRVLGWGRGEGKRVLEWEREEGKQVLGWGRGEGKQVLG